MVVLKTHNWQQDLKISVWQTFEKQSSFADIIFIFQYVLRFSN